MFIPRFGYLPDVSKAARVKDVISDGYSQGDEFDEDGAPHQKMIVCLKSDQ